ncbi:hypothetical protein BOW46_08430 [Solemya velum gill symbiont]|nr:hypothetical protein BOW46_08430 [Solemya velum gill symbiont]
MLLKRFIFVITVLAYSITSTGFAESIKLTEVAHLYSELLPNTDGYGLLPKPPALTKEQSDKLFAIGKQSCDSQCATSFGKVLGKADNAIGYSNCSSACIRPRFSFLNLKTGEVTIHDDDPKNADLHYIGLIYQCVEYSRRWWMKNKGITYGSVDSAYEILYLTEGKDLHTGKNFPLARSINGTTQRLPKRGDLLIYHPTKDDPKWRYGHVAVVVDVDLKAGTISVAEENYSNLPWEDPGKYSRKIRLFNISGRYTVLDVPTGESNNPGGARVSGWVYPLSDK